MSLLFLVALPVLSLASGVDSRTAKTHYLSVFAGESALILGSQQVRIGGGFSYAYGRPEPRFHLWRFPAQLVYEGYVDHTQHAAGPGISEGTVAYGVLAYARWRGARTHAGWGLYADVGWGLQYAEHPTYDLDSRLNSTPVIDFGGAVPFGSQEFMLGLRYLHISNAGTVRPNLGQNEFFLMFGVRF